MAWTSTITEASTEAPTSRAKAASDYDRTKIRLPHTEQRSAGVVNADLKVNKNAAETTASASVNVDGKSGIDVDVTSGELVRLLAQAGADRRSSGHHGGGGEGSRDEADNVGEEHREE